MEKKEYLNEESYQQAKKKITRISLIILVVGLVIGIALIVAGAIKQSNVKKANEKAYNEAYELSKQKYEEAETRLKEIDKEKTELNSQIQTKQHACNSLDISSPTWFADKSSCQSEVSALQSKLTDLESEEFKLENGDYTVMYYPILSIKYLMFYFIGGGVIGTACLISGIFYLIAKRREIRAFTIQQTMPVTQEVIGKMAPTIGNAAGTIGKDLAQGITSGIKEGLNSQQPESTESTENKEI